MNQPEGHGFFSFLCGIPIAAAVLVFALVVIVVMAVVFVLTLPFRVWSWYHGAGASTARSPSNTGPDNPDV